FRQAGIEIIEALKVSPLRMLFRRLDLRQHRKIIVIDDNIAYTGSMNMVDPTKFKQDAGVGQWVDIMARVSGPASNVMGAIHAWDWEVETGHRELPTFPVCEINPDSIPHPIQVVPSGPGMPVNLIQQVLTLAINQAEHSVRITTPYFVPSDHLLQVLMMTAQRGVTVELIIPHDNDSFLVNWASKSFFSDLLAAGVQIYQFKGGLLHTKSVVIDQSYSLIGTVNLDMRSLWLNFELTLVIQDKDFSARFYQLQQDYIAQSVRVRQQDWKARGWYKKLLERLFYLFNPLL
ncbi:MAG: cardiolipin synthase, partial [Vibrio sp.]